MPTADVSMSPGPDNITEDVQPGTDGQPMEEEGEIEKKETAAPMEDGVAPDVEATSGLPVIIEDQEGPHEA